MRILVLGAGGAIAREFIPLAQSDHDLRLFVRSKGKLSAHDERAFIGDAENISALTAAMTGIDLVVSMLGPRGVDRLAVNVLRAMHDTGVNRLVLVSSAGVYDEVSGAVGLRIRALGAYIDEQRRACDLIEQSSVDYTILRPMYLTDGKETIYRTFQKGEQIIGGEISRKAVAHAIKDIVCENTFRRQSIGLANAI